MTAILFVALVLSPDVSPLVDQLGAPKFADRERADRELAQRMTWALAVRLEQTPATSPEARRRVARLVAQWWAAQYPAPEQCPYIDSLNAEKLCCPPDVAIVRHYLRRSGDAMELHAGYDYPAYRRATWLMVEDLRRLRIPPMLVRPLLAYMAERSARWDFERRHPHAGSEFRP
jgi:hypothetical protein